MDLDNELMSFTTTQGVDFWGVADLSLAQDAINDQGGSEIAAYPRGISMGIELLHTIVDMLPQRADRAVSVEYKSHCYDYINERLDQVASQVGSILQRKGFRAFPVPAAKRVDDERICAVFSHKLAANLAGLGWIGKSCLLVTPEAGPRIRWVTVLTDAPLQVTGEPMQEQCGTCHACVDICPVHAFTGRAFNIEDPRETRFDAHKCQAYFDELEETTSPAVCGMCLYVCPHGRHRGESKNGSEN